MKLNPMIALAVAASISACSSGSGNDTAIIAAANKYMAAYPICDLWMPSTEYWPRNRRPIFDLESPAPWLQTLLKAGLLVKRPTVPPGYILAPTQRLQIVHGEICVGHVVADALVKTEPITDAQAGYLGISKDALVAEFKTHFQDSDWTTMPHLREEIRPLEIRRRDRLSTRVPALRLIVINDPIKKWTVVGEQ
jgi:hypothetical protein